MLFQEGTELVKKSAIVNREHFIYLSTLTWTFLAEAPLYGFSIEHILYGLFLTLLNVI